MSNELFGSFFNIHEKHIPYFHTHMKYKKPKKNASEPKEKEKKWRNKSRNENESECSMNYFNQFLISKRTTFHLSKCT